MADVQNQEPNQEPQGQQGQQAQQEPGQEPQGAQGAQAQQEPGQGQEPPVVDTHGQPGINRERHDREVAELQAQIEELRAQVADASEQKAKRGEFEAKVAELEAKLADGNVTHSLEMAGCIDVKSAKARLEDFGGDVAKLKDGCPHLFGPKAPAGTTGPRPGGAPSAADELVAKAREAAGTTRYYTTS